jgi:hypothetical protein
MRLFLFGISPNVLNFIRSILPMCLMVSEYARRNLHFQQGLPAVSVSGKLLGDNILAWKEQTTKLKFHSEP